MAKRGTKAWQKEQNAKLKKAQKRHAKDVAAAQAGQAAQAKADAQAASDRAAAIKARNAAISAGLKARAEALRQKREKQ